MTLEHFIQTRLERAVNKPVYLIEVLTFTALLNRTKQSSCSIAIVFIVSSCCGDQVVKKTVIFIAVLKNIIQLKLKVQLEALGLIYFRPQST